MTSLSPNVVEMDAVSVSHSRYTCAATYLHLGLDATHRHLHVEYEVLPSN